MIKANARDNNTDKENCASSTAIRGGGAAASNDNTDEKNGAIGTASTVCTVNISGIGRTGVGNIQDTSSACGSNKSI